MKKDKRNDIRIPLLGELCGIYFIGKGTDDYALFDIAEGGACVKVNDVARLPKPKSKCVVQFKLPGSLGGLYIESEVVRINWAKIKTREIGFALKFGPLTEGNKKIWDAYRVYMRNKQIINVSKKIIEEFFGSQK